MNRYIPNSVSNREQMLKTLNLKSIDELFTEIPEHLKVDALQLESSKSELEILQEITKKSAQNRSVEDKVCFLGAGAYDHYIPSIVNHLSSRGEFYTSYTPYQAEISQGTLRAIFEYQSYISKITGLSVSNASLYDGATAVAEAGLMAISAVKKSDTLLVSCALNPDVMAVLKTYCQNKEIKIVEISQKDGKTDVENLQNTLESTSNVAAVIIQSPNYYGVIEEVSDISELTHQKKAKCVLYADPLSFGILKSPAECGVDIAVGDAQAFGLDLNFGGPYLGYMCTTEDLARKMPGRIAGETVDADGNRCYVLTLQAREQHIRRYKATSNICSNQSLMALRATIYLSVMGKAGYREVAQRCYNNAHYMASELLKTSKCKLHSSGDFFKEFTVQFNVEQVDMDRLMEKFKEHSILPGIRLSDNRLIIAVTEKRTKEQIDAFVSIVREI